MDTGTQTECRGGDGCCPGNRNANNDGDCSARCGNGITESGELCDGNCPTSCNNDGCTRMTVQGSGCNARCAASGTLPNGSACGSGNVCFDGDCRPCPNSGTCNRNENRCKNGVNRCVDGQSRCEDGGNKPRGTDCGAGRVCDGNGNCVMDCGGTVEGPCCDRHICQRPLRCVCPDTPIDVGVCRRPRATNDDCMYHDECEYGAHCDSNTFSCQPGAPTEEFNYSCDPFVR
jgi:hypothetical protein